MSEKKIEEKYVIVQNKGEVSVLYKDDVSGENLLAFSVDFEDNEEVASYIAFELQDIVRMLNWQKHELMENGIDFP